MCSKDSVCFMNSDTLGRGLFANVQELRNSLRLISRSVLLVMVIASLPSIDFSFLALLFCLFLESVNCSWKGQYVVRTIQSPPSLSIIRPTQENVFGSCLVVREVELDVEFALKLELDLHSTPEHWSNHPLEPFFHLWNECWRVPIVINPTR